MTSCSTILTHTSGPPPRLRFLQQHNLYLTHSFLELLLKNGFWSYSTSFLVTVWPKSTKTCPNFAWKSGSEQFFVPDGRLQLQKFEHAQKAKFRDSFWAKKFPCPLDFYFSLVLLAASFVFLAPFFLDSAGYLVSFGSVGNMFTKPPRIVKLFLNKVLEGSGAKSYMFFCVFLWTAWLNDANLGMVWKIFCSWTS